MYFSLEYGIFKNTKSQKKEVFNKNNENIDNQEVKANDVLTYKITYKNTSDRELDVTITDELPKHTVLLSMVQLYMMILLITDWHGEEGCHQRRQ